ncbi:MAG: MmcQ/YjbR family DNA-binding protein [Chloroflexi bacterium]|nr:MmcQ/YjbR family DNA-binding protein [Chloroflexota bacterium]MDA1241082.1 MmcQ/YjbR family DNA-binding protein [Chloroflexota bacterium]
MPAPRRASTQAATATAAALERRKRRLATLCEAYPETTAGSPYENEHLSLEVAGKRFGYYLERHFGDDGRSGAVLKAGPGVQEALVEQDPVRFWVPAFVGRHGWIGIRFDLDEPDWDEVAEFVDDSWRLTAPKRLRGAPAPSL